MRSTTRLGRFSLGLSLALGLFVSTVGARADDLRPVPVSTETSGPGPGVNGVATYYSKRYEGRRTTSGEKYHPEKLTAAHPSAPLGALLRVVHLESGKSVVVRVNDRCRKKRFPFIDLSRAAARELGFLGKGKAKVKITRVEGEAPDPVVAEAASPQSE